MPRAERQWRLLAGSPLPNSGSPVGEFYAATITPDYESGGQEFESLRARHFAFQINGSRGRLGATIGAANWWRI
jgi:hypothetical protein